jgi:DNA-binding transcriptional LysR family regulator
VAELRRLQYFLAVAQERNFTRAAERLHVAQPALSRQVRLLEQELGVELLHRTTHAFELTEAGAYLLERGPALLSAADELWRGIASFAAGERGGVVVASGASASYETAPRLLHELRERHPGIAVTTEIRSVDAIVAGLGAGTIDLGIVRCPPHGTDLELRTVRQERQGLLVRRDHRLAAGAEVRLEDLADETLLLHPRETNPGHYDAVLELCRNRGVEPRVLLRSVSFDVAQTPVLQGDALAIVGESSAAGLSGELRWLLLEPAAMLDVRAPRPPR